MSGARDRPLAGQVALVTGASSGLGERFARTLACAGAHVAIAARRMERLEALVAAIEAEGGRAKAIELDMRSADQISMVVSEAEKRLGSPVQILINNAGLGITRKSTDLTLDEIDSMLGVNLRGPFLMARAVARRLIAEGLPGRIINLSSIGAFHHDGRVPSAFYSMTKSAIVRMTEVLAVEWARHHINVNAIAPGFFRSEMSNPMIEREGERLLSGFARGRVGEPEHLDSTLLYLVSGGSSMVTGTCIVVDDGQMPR